MTLTKRSILAGSVLLTLVLVVGADLGLVGPGARRNAGFGLKADALASMRLRGKTCV